MEPTSRKVSIIGDTLAMAQMYKFVLEISGFTNVTLCISPNDLLANKPDLIVAVCTYGINYNSALLTEVNKLAPIPVAVIIGTKEMMVVNGVEYGIHLPQDVSVILNGFINKKT